MSSSQPNQEARTHDLWFRMWWALAKPETNTQHTGRSGRFIFTSCAVLAMGAAAAVFLKGSPPWREPAVVGLVFVVASLEALRSRAAVRVLRATYLAQLTPLADVEPLRAMWRERLRARSLRTSLSYIQVRDRMRWYRSFAAVAVFLALMYPAWFERFVALLHLPAGRAVSSLMLVAAVLIPAWFLVNVVSLARDTSKARRMVTHRCCLKCGGEIPENAGDSRCSGCGADSPLLPPP